MSGLIFISLLLNFVCIYFIYILWKKLQQSFQRDAGESFENIGELLELFSQEMREENDRLTQMILQYKNESQQGKRIEPELQSETTEPKDESLILEEKTSEEPEMNEVLLLAQQGYTAVEIAKKLNRGKGEIELLLKFYA